MRFSRSVLATSAALVFSPLAPSQPMTNHPLFIGTYTRETSKGIYAVQLDATTGALTPPELAAETKGPSYLALSPDQSHLYAVSESEAMACGFSVAPDRRHLSPLQTIQSAGGKAPCHLVVDQTARTLLVANYHTGVVAALPLAPDGVLGRPATVIQHHGSSVNPDRQASAHVHSVTLSPDNRHVLVCDLGLDKIFTYRVDPATATLQAAQTPFTVTPPGSGPRHMAFSRSGKFVFCVFEMAGTVTAYRYHPENGSLSAGDTQSTLPPGFSGENTSAAIRVHPNGRFVYASNRGADDIAIFTFDEASGRLSRIANVASGGKGPRDFALSPDGRWLVVAHQNSNSLNVLSVDASTGLLTPTPQTATVSMPVCVLFAD